MQSESRVVVIIGGGPAGIGCAIQLKRYGLEPVIFEKDEIGGLARNANLVENYLGFPEGISGTDLIRLFQEQIERSKVEVRFEEVKKLDHSGGRFFIKTNRQKMNCKIVIIASGTKPIIPSDIPISDNNDDRILSEIFPILKIEGKKIAIVGSGDVAFDYALNLSKKNRVIIVNKRKSVKCLPLLFEAIESNENIDYWERARVISVCSDMDDLILTVQQGSQTEKISVSYLVLAIGRESNLDFLSDPLRKKLKELQRKKKLFKIGDVKNFHFRQVAIAVGDGVRAAMEIYQTFNRVET